MPAVGFHHARHDHRWYGEADHGRVASKRQTSYGFKLPLLISASGLVLDFALVAASAAGGTLAEQLLIDKAGLTVLGDKGYITGSLHGSVGLCGDGSPGREKRHQESQLRVPF